mmetsp:Transcript_73921/g.154052  ORF Transcript_73921/g.154052 Transcript_73921/m.154052 type:complete len:173 (+) Transcript_73921:87-605(+)
MSFALSKRLLEEFRPYVASYNLTAVCLGLVFGAMDGPRPVQTALGDKASKALAAPDSDASAASEGSAAATALASEGISLDANSTESPWDKAKKSAQHISDSQPQELTFVRQFLLTLPGIDLALRLGKRARAIGAPPTALLGAATPALGMPLVLYLIGGYPSGVALRGLYDSM